MNEEPPKDPFALSREWLTQWERSVNEILTKHMSTTEFAKQMSESSALSASTMQALTKVMGPIIPATK